MPRVFSRRGNVTCEQIPCEQLVRGIVVGDENDIDESHHLLYSIRPLLDQWFQNLRRNQEQHMIYRGTTYLDQLESIHLVSHNQKCTFLAKNLFDFMSTSARSIVPRFHHKVLIRYFVHFFYHVYNRSTPILVSPKDNVSSPS